MRYVSSSWCRDYGSGQFYEGPAELDLLRAASADHPGIELNEPLFAAASYRRPTPNLLSCSSGEWERQVLAHLENLNANFGTTHASSVSLLADAVIHHNVLAVGRGGEQAIIYESHRPGDRPFMEFDPAGDLAPTATLPPGHAYLFLGGPGFRNYGHWVVDDLPKLKAVEAIRGWDSQPLAIVLADAGPVLNKVKQQSILALLGPGKVDRIVFIRPEQRVAVERLYWVSPTNKSPHFQIPDALDWLAAAGRAAVVPLRRDGSLPRRILVGRRRSDGRCMSNQARLLAALAPHGFQEIEAGELGFVEQVALFAHAEMVVGAMGAAMASSVFASPACDLVYLAPEGWSETFFLDIAAVRGQAYSVAYGRPDDAEVPPHLSSYTLSEQAVAAIVGHVARSDASTRLRSAGSVIQRFEVVQKLLDLYQDPTYLEVGVSSGETFNRITARRKVAVDPRFLFEARNTYADGREAVFHEVASDRYFGSVATPADRFDVIYLDGLHTFEQTLRDLMNAVMVIKPGGCIVLDDVMPSSYLASISDLATFQEAHRVAAAADPRVAADGSWMGDVYKLVFFIQAFLQQFSYATVLENHGQTVLWRQARAEGIIPPGTVAALCSLEYKDVLLQSAAFNILPFADIVSLVTASLARR